MDAERVNPFVEAAFAAFEEVTGRGVGRGVLSVRAENAPFRGLCCVVGVTGDVDGAVLLDLGEQQGRALAELVTGRKTERLDAMAQVAVFGLVSLIVRQALEALGAQGLRAAASTPGLFCGGNMRFLFGEREVLRVPLKLSIGEVDLCLALREARKDG
jgi:CheY-specific phosphatase CheX